MQEIKELTSMHRSEPVAEIMGIERRLISCEIALEQVEIEIERLEATRQGNLPSDAD
jgi:hypothetical protein